jgi:L-seryl-tRNA(Ser) seleniumtransferase
MAIKTADTDALQAKFYRMLPSVNEVLLIGSVESLCHVYLRDAVVRTTQKLLEEIREEISTGSHSQETLAVRLAALPETINNRMKQPFDFSLRPVINATGVILHTNLGRAPLSRPALDRIIEVAGGYSNLELNLDTGERGSRDIHVEGLLLSILGQAASVDNLAKTHRAIVVNNCAAATFLVLHALAGGKEVLVSRGELVEIGGGFRIPEILAESGASLKEVGTTNRTRVADYESALTPDTGLILCVHQSNFSMEGFIEKPSLEELVQLGRRAQVPVFVDQGTGLVQIPALGPGLANEPTLAQCIAHGCELIAASGDKLLGGPQCGIIVGRKDLVERVRKNPLFRTYRVDKLVYAALEATLAVYAAHIPEQIPILRMLFDPAERIRERCETIAAAIDRPGDFIDVIPVESVVGGGAAPKARLRSFALALRPQACDAAALLRHLRRSDPPIIARIENDQVVLDLRTVEPHLDSSLVNLLNAALRSGPRVTAKRIDE